MINKIQISLPSLGKAEWQAIKEPIMNGWVTQGPKVKEFERLFAEKYQVKHAYAVTNCTAALHLALLALGIGPGDEVIVPAFTWVSTANAVLYCGATPLFVDIDLQTFNLDPEKIKKVITSRTKAIIPVHLFGLCCDIDEIKKKAPFLKIVEDAACAVGSNYKNKPAGSLGDIGCFSFHPRKVITTGEGGMVTTQNSKFASTIDSLRNHGASLTEELRHIGSKPYILPEFNILGYNYRMTDLQGAIGIVQLNKIDDLINERNKWAHYYKSKLKDIAWIKLPRIHQDYQTNWQSFVCLIDENISPFSRNKLMEILYQKGISTRPGTHAVHLLNYYKKKYQFKSQDYPNAYLADKTSIALPLHNRMKKKEYDYVINVIKNICAV